MAMSLVEDGILVDDEIIIEGMGACGMPLGIGSADLRDDEMPGLVLCPLCTRECGGAPPACESMNLGVISINCE